MDRATARRVFRWLRVTTTLVITGLVICNRALASGDAGLVPISWALDVRNGKSSNVAVAVPWSLDYARGLRRTNPALFRFFPHVSLLGSADAQSATLSNNPHFAIGCGVGLANALAVGISVPTNAPLAHTYVMAGLSLTDLVKLTLF